jgi:branched-chain amino acid transport system permease protein
MRIPFALGIILAALAFGAVGVSVNPYLSFVLTRVLVYVILTMGLNILMGYAGQFAFVHAALYGIGAYVAGLLEVRLG